MTVTSVTTKLLSRVVSHVTYGHNTNNCMNLSNIKIKESQRIFLGETDILDIFDLL